MMVGMNPKGIDFLKESGAKRHPILSQFLTQNQYGFAFGKTTYTPWFLFHFFSVRKAEREEKTE